MKFAVTKIIIVCLNYVILFSVSPADTLQSHLYADGLCPTSTSPGVPHLRCSRRASEASIASQVSGLADSYTATNIATSKFIYSVLRLTLILVLDHIVKRSPSCCPPSFNLPPANKCEASHIKRPSLLSQLPLPYNRFVSWSATTCLHNKILRVFPRANSLEPEQSSDLSSDMTSDLTDVTSDITDISSVPPSPRLLKNIKQGTLAAVVQK